jgi:hypothetical protein
VSASVLSASCNWYLPDINIFFNYKIIVIIVNGPWETNHRKGIKLVGRKKKAWSWCTSQKEEKKKCSMKCWELLESGGNENSCRRSKSQNLMNCVKGSMFRMLIDLNGSLFKSWRIQTTYYMFGFSHISRESSESHRAMWTWRHGRRTSPGLSRVTSPGKEASPFSCTLFSPALRGRAPSIQPGTQGSTTKL